MKKNESNKILYSERFAHYLHLLFYPFRDNKELLSEHPPSCQKKLLETVQTVINSNKIKFEPYGALFDGTFSCCNANMLGNEDFFGRIENDETEESVY